MARLYLSQSLCMLSKLKKARGRLWSLPSSEEATGRGWHMDRQHGVGRSLAPTEGAGRNHRAPRSTPHGHKAGSRVSGRGGHGDEAAPCAQRPKLRVPVCPAGLRSEKGFAQLFLECPGWAGPRPGPHSPPSQGGSQAFPPLAGAAGLRTGLTPPRAPVGRKGTWHGWTMRNTPTLKKGRAAPPASRRHYF